MLAIWFLVPLPFLKPAWTSGSSRFWSLAWRILSITLLVCETRDIRGIQMKANESQQRDQLFLDGELSKTSWRRWHVSHVVQKERLSHRDDECGEGNKESDDYVRRVWCKLWDSKVKPGVHETQDGKACGSTLWKILLPTEKIRIFPGRKWGALGDVWAGKEHAEVVLIRENSDCYLQIDLKHKSQKLWDRY